MSMSDPLADMITRIRNAGMVNFRTVDVPLSSLKVDVAKVLKDEGYIEDYQIVKDTVQGTMRINLKYGANGAPELAMRVLWKWIAIFLGHLRLVSIGDRPPRELSRHTLAEVVEPRYEELLSLVQAELRRSGFEDLLTGGIVLTGGSSKMTGLVDLAEEIFHMPVRLGMPKYVTGLADVINNPIYATGVGLLLFGRSNANGSIRDLPASGGVGEVFARMRSWFQGNF